MFENPKTLNHFQQGDRGHLSKLIETVVSLTNYTVIYCRKTKWVWVCAYNCESLWNPILNK